MFIKKYFLILKRNQTGKKNPIQSIPLLNILSF